MSLLEGIGLFRGARDARSTHEIEREITDELELHLELKVEGNVAAGMNPDAARRDALARFGDVERIRRACRRVQLGERIMLQRTKTILIGVLVIAVCFLAVDSYLMRRETTASTHRMSSVMDEMLRAVRGEGPSTPFEAAHGFDGLAAGSPRIIGSWFSAAEPREVVIRVGDELKIQDFANRGVDVTERVARDGMVLMPDVGWVEVAGKTRVQVELELSQAYQQFYSSAPDVKVKVVE